jgi:hypothetical protein
MVFALRLIAGGLTYNKEATTKIESRAMVNLAKIQKY